MLGDIELIALQQQRRLRTQKINEKKKKLIRCPMWTLLLFLTVHSFFIYYVLLYDIRYKWNANHWGHCDTAGTYMRVRVSVCLCSRLVPFPNSEAMRNKLQMAHWSPSRNHSLVSQRSQSFLLQLCNCTDGKNFTSKIQDGRRPIPYIENSVPGRLKFSEINKF